MINVEKILKVLAKYEYNVFINKSYIGDSAHIHDKFYHFVASCYEWNTGFGDIIVDPSTLEVSVGYPELKLSTSFSVPQTKESSDLNQYLL